MKKSKLIQGYKSQSFFGLKQRKTRLVLSIIVAFSVLTIFPSAHSQDESISEYLQIPVIAEVFGLDPDEFERMIDEGSLSPQVLQRSVGWICDYMSYDYLLAIDRGTCFAEVMAKSYGKGPYFHIFMVTVVLEARDYCGIDAPPGTFDEFKCIDSMVVAITEKRFEESDND